MTTYTDGYGGDTTTAVDTRLNSGQATYNYGAGAALDPNGAPLLMYFDLSAIPAGATCNSATLHVYNLNTKNSTRYVTVYSIKTANWPWAEGTKNGSQAGAGEPCWNARAADGSGGVTTAWAGSAGCATSGTDYDATPIGLFEYTANDAVGTEITASLTTSVVEGWFGESNTNYGIRLISSDAFPAIASSDNATAGYRPKLVIDYTADEGEEYQQSVSGTLTSAGALGTLKLMAAAVGGALTSAGGMIKRSARGLAGALGAGISDTFTDGYGGDVFSADDAQMSSVWNDRNGGGHANFAFETQQRSLLRFDLEDVPAGAVCTAATLYLYHSYGAEGGGTITVYVHEISDANGDWIAGTSNIAVAAAGECTWDAKAADGSGGVAVAWAGSAGCTTPGDDYKTPALGTFAFNGGVDIGTEFTCALDTDAVAGWFGQPTNNGIIMWGSSNSGHVAQSDNETTGYRPKLVVSYTIPGGLTGELTALKTLAAILTGGLTLAGSLVKRAGKAGTGGLASAGAVIRQAGKTTAGALASAGDLITQLAATAHDLAVGGAIGLAGSLSRQAQIARGGALANWGGVGKWVARAVGGALGLTAALIGLIAGLPVPADQTYTVPGEDRVYRIAAEERTYRVPARKR